MKIKISKYKIMSSVDEEILMDCYGIEYIQVHVPWQCRDVYAISVERRILSLDSIVFCMLIV